MSDIKLFRIEHDAAHELPGQSVAVERTLQTLIERHLDALLGVRFLASEYSTGKAHGGRIDTLGLDENNSPVIIEYKRAINENVINQGLFYLNWLMDHRADFELLALRQLGQKAANAIDWHYPRLLCIAGDFTKYDEQAVQQIPRNIELIRYKRYGDDLLLLDLVNATTAQPVEDVAGESGIVRPKPRFGERSGRTAADQLAHASPQLHDLFEAIASFLTALGDDVQMKTLTSNFAFRRIKNFASILVHPKAGHLLVYVKVDPASVQLEPGFTRDMQNIGHYGTGDLEITIRTDDDLERAKPLLLQSYEAS